MNTILELYSSRNTVLLLLEHNSRVVLFLNLVICTVCSEMTVAGSMP